MRECGKLPAHPLQTPMDIAFARNAPFLYSVIGYKTVYYPRQAWANGPRIQTAFIQFWATIITFSVP
jgi:hypothetical protein